MATLTGLVLIDGMTPNLEPFSPFGEYEAFWQRLVRRRADLPGLVRQPSR